MKRIIALFSFFIILFTCSAYAATKSKNVYIFYRVPDSVLLCQNKEENMMRGRKEFEETIRKYYNKRFVVKNIEQAPSDKQPIEYFTSKCALGQYVLILTVTPEGQGTQSQLYSNAYGAQINAESPTVLIHLVETIMPPGTGKATLYDYRTQAYGKGTYAIGRQVFVVDSDTRRNTKAAIEGCLRDACKFNITNINKYANEQAYKIEEWRYAGDFDKIFQIQEADIAKIKARVEAFRIWCNSDPNLIAARKPLIQALDAYASDPYMQSKIIDQWIAMGTYVESGIEK